MGKRALAEQLERDQVLATRALATLMLNELPDEVRLRVHQAIHDGTGDVELRTRIDTGQTEVGVRADGWVGAAVVRALRSGRTLVNGLRL